MSRRSSPMPMLPQKRPRPNSSPSLTETERKVYDLIVKSGDSGIIKTNIQKGVHLQVNTISKNLKSLTEKCLVKAVPSAQKKGMVYFFAADVEPSKQVSGGEWYTDGALDTAFIDALQRISFSLLRTNRVATLKDLHKYIEDHPAIKVSVEMGQVKQILESMVLGGDIEKVISTGTGDFEDIMAGGHCYRIPRKGGGATAAKSGVFSSIPCGVCPRINECSPEGIISPRTCEFYQRWLEEDDSKTQD